MPRGDDRVLARSLADALDGRAQPTGELEALVRVLEAAAAEARFDVSQAETGSAPWPRPAPARCGGSGSCCPRRSPPERRWRSRRGCSCSRRPARRRS